MEAEGTSLPRRGDAAAGTAEPLATVFTRIQAELDDIARRIDRNQAAIARSTWALGASDADYVSAMQDADLSAQRIAGVADFLRALGDASHPAWRVDTAPATGTLKLSQLVRSLGTAGLTMQAEEEEAAGDADFF